MTTTYTKDLVIFDLDGTLANADHRQYLIDRTPKDWDAYFALSVADAPNWPVIRTFWALEAAAILSRPAICRYGPDAARRTGWRPSGG